MKLNIAFPIGWLIFLLQACSPLYAPTVSTNVIEADNIKGNLLSVSAHHCNVLCERLALEKAQTVCTNGFTIHNSERQASFAPDHFTIYVRCKPK